MPMSCPTPAATPTASTGVTLTHGFSMRGRRLVLEIVRGLLELILPGEPIRSRQLAGSAARGHLQELR